MTQALITEQQARQTQFTREQIELIKRTICVGATDDEMTLFIMQANRMGLDPFAKQIHAVKRRVKNQATGNYEDRMAIQVGIDGYRLVADRTMRYAPGRENTFTYDANGNLASATAYVWKLVAGEWRECAAVAHYDEYVQTTRDGKPVSVWATGPHIMLGKCAEALALRRAFPAELSGVYTDEEMGRADSEPVAIRQKDGAQPGDQAGAHVSDAWKSEIKDLGIAASELMKDAPAELATDISAALAFARDVLKRNGSTTEAERIDARSMLQAVIARAQGAPQPA